MIRPGKSSYDLMFITMFASIDDLNAYLSHPVHSKIGHEISENITNQASVCVESND
ncbi:MAG: Stress responsive Barrel Domain [Herbinix sp.]|jgi:hypothetical protein|nr:Stress responsive Barrel Domain [Herbinix sp.]